MSFLEQRLQFFGSGLSCVDTGDVLEVDLRDVPDDNMTTNLVPSGETVFIPMCRATSSITFFSAVLPLESGKSGRCPAPGQAANRSSNRRQ